MTPPRRPTDKLPKPMKIINVDEGDDVFVGGRIRSPHNTGNMPERKIKDQVFIVAIGDELVLQGTIDAFHELSGQLGLIAAELERATLETEVQYGREIAKGEGWTLT